MAQPRLVVIAMAEPQAVFLPGGMHHIPPYGQISPLLPPEDDQA